MADELFFCGSAAEVTPILSVDRLPVGRRHGRDATQALRAAFLSTVRGEAADRAAG